jgi:hypothetical protein
LGSLDSVSFVVDAHTALRKGEYGMVEMVYEGEKPLARKTITDNYDLAKIMMDINILDLATDTGNPHLLHLRCAYTQENRACLVLYPWYKFD